MRNEKAIERGSNLIGRIFADFSNTNKFKILK